MNDTTQTALEAATFRRLVKHLQKNTQVQNIDLMILADFCRNCLAKWYLEEAKNQGLDLDYEQVREMVYGMPYEQWKQQFQLEASPEQLTAFERKQQSKL